MERIEPSRRSRKEGENSNQVRRAKLKTQNLPKQSLPMPFAQLV
jgi:hypothetical protein